MTELLEAIKVWPSLLVVVVVFGLAPGLGLRLIVLGYPPADPRRAELIAELYAVPRIAAPVGRRAAGGHAVRGPRTPHISTVRRRHAHVRYHTSGPAGAD